MNPGRIKKFSLTETQPYHSSSAICCTFLFPTRSIKYNLAKMALETTLIAKKICGTCSTWGIQNEKKGAAKDNAFSLLKSPPLVTRKTRTENRRHSFGELVVTYRCWTMDSALRCPYKPFKLGLGGKQVTRYTREKQGILSCLIIKIIVIKNNNLYFNW